MAARQGNLRKYQKGFTLLEFLIAVMVLSVGLLGMASLTGAMINFNRTAYNSTKAVTLAEEKMEELRNLNYQSLSAGYDTESIFTRTWTLSADVPDTDMTTITVTVTWTWKGTSKSIDIQSIVGR
jgi:type IV pilus assembly protein PilV